MESAPVKALSDKTYYREEGRTLLQRLCATWLIVHVWLYQ